MKKTGGSFPKISPELDLVLSCLKHALGENAKEEPEIQIPKAVNWKHFMLLLERHRVFAPVYCSLKSSDPDKIPVSVMSRLKGRIHNTTRQTLLKASELGHIQKAFNGRHIPSLALKGPALALLAFGDLGCRHVGDLDLFISERDLKRADACLHERGYLRCIPDSPLTSRQDAVYRRNNSHFSYFCPQKRILLELHYRCAPLSSLFPLRFQNAWEKRNTVPLGDFNIATFSIEHTLMHLCVHGAVHAWRRLFWIADVAKLMHDNPKIHWEALFDRSRHMGISRMVAQGLILGHMLLGAPLPEVLTEALQKEKKTPYLVKTALKRIRSSSGDPNLPLSSDYIRKKVYDFLLRPDWHYKLAFILYQIGPAYDEWEMCFLPAQMFSFYFMAKPFSLFSRWRMHYKGSR